MRDKQQTNKRTLKIELLSQWNLEAEFRNIVVWPKDWIYNVDSTFISQSRRFSNSALPAIVSICHYDPLNLSKTLLDMTFQWTAICFGQCYTYLLFSKTIPENPQFWLT